MEEEGRMKGIWGGVIMGRGGGMKEEVKKENEGYRYSMK